MLSEKNSSKKWQKKTVESDLEEENLQLRNQIDEMETFLADYGLVWVGSNRLDSDSDSDESNIEKTDSEYDWIKIVRNVKERVLDNKPWFKVQVFMAKSLL